MTALPLIQIGFLIFPYMSSGFQFNEYCKQQKALNHLTKCQKDFTLNVKTVVTLYTQVHAYIHGVSILNGDGGDNSPLDWESCKLV